jgi:hypothetical protein
MNIDWPELLKAGGAFVGTALGVWNFVAAMRTGVVVYRGPASLLITNTGRRPVCVDAIGFIQAGRWEPYTAGLDRSSVDEPDLPLLIEPWRSASLTPDLRAHLEVNYDTAVRTYWFAHLEHGATASTVPWYRPDHRWRLRRSVRRAYLEDPFSQRRTVSRSATRSAAESMPKLSYRLN